MNSLNWLPTRRRLVTRVELNDTAREFLEASMRADRSRRLRRRMLVTGVIVVLAAAAVIAAVGFSRATREARDAPAAQLDTEANGVFTGHRR